MTTLDDVLARLGALPEKQRNELTELALAATAGMAFIPSPGIQTEAYFCPADVLLYGGSGGSGKSSLLLGLAMTAHRRSLIMRRHYTDLNAMTEEAVMFNGTRDGFNGSPPPRLRTKDGRLIEFGAAAHLGDEQHWQGQPHDFLGLDEAVQFLEAQVRFLMGWVRHGPGVDKGQRTRVVLATNPPVDADGMWIIGMFRPWLDITHPNPAKPGELRWFVTDPDGKDLEVDGPDPVEMEGQDYIPQSRTFIPAALRDNPFLSDTGYKAKLDALPEPLRSAVRDGNFMAARKDDDWQVIPTDWVLQAQARWKDDGWRAWNMTAMSLDPAGGGRDSAELAYRHRGWFGPLISTQGPETADGSATAAMVTKHRRHAAPIVVDVGGGYASGVVLRLKDNGIDHLPFNGASHSVSKTKDGQLGFFNKRAEAWWKFREELDPDQEGGSVIALPPDTELRSDLTAPTYELVTRGIKIESKDDIRERLGRSPGKGDAVVMCLSPGHQAVKRASTTRPKVISGYDKRRRR